MEAANDMLCDNGSVSNTKPSVIRVPFCCLEIIRRLRSCIFSVISDINECNSQRLNICPQVCTNTDGGFSCSCHAGFTTDPVNGTLCIGKFQCVVVVVVNFAAFSYTDKISISCLS